MRTVKIVLTSVVLAMLLLGLILPIAAEACGCGMVLPHEGDLDVTQERAIIRWDGQTEDIIMALQAHGDAKEAAWIMPMPSPAKVKLGDPQMFEFLQEFTKPRIEHKTVILDHPEPIATTAPAGVTVLDRREIGLYDVSTLAATDATDLTQWLNTNGYKLPDTASKVLQPYVDQGWYYIAARLSPGIADEVAGELDPLWMTFKSDRVVYPMRPTALARNPESVYLYILADHRMMIMELQTSFAGWISASDLPVGDHPLQQVIDRKYFLTKLQTVIDNPEEQVKDDYYAYQVSDAEYREVEVITDYQYVPPPASSPAVSSTAPASTTNSDVSFAYGVPLAGLVVVALVAGIVVYRRRIDGTRK